MIKIMVGIILAPFALISGVFTLAFAIGAIKGLAQVIKGE